MSWRGGVEPRQGNALESIIGDHCLLRVLVPVKTAEIDFPVEIDSSYPIRSSWETQFTAM